jgi:hypothetical protein
MKRSIGFPNTCVLDRFETAAGSDIPNCQDLSIMSYDDTASRRASYKRRFLGAEPRTTDPTGVYNCHGFVFGAGRTGIEGGDVRMILEDDGYTRVNIEQTMPGDVVLYIAEDGDIEHSAILVRPAHKSLSGHAIVVSKWGNFTEYVHDLPLCPYSATNVEYWRLSGRPRPKQFKKESRCLILT